MSDYDVIQQGRVVISPEEALARESAGEPRLTTADRFEGLDVSLVRSGDELLEAKGAWVHRRAISQAEGSDAVKTLRDAARLGYQDYEECATERDIARSEIARLTAELERVTRERNEYAERLQWHRDERDAYMRGNLWVNRTAEERERAERAEAEVERLRGIIREHWSPSQAEAILAATPTPEERDLEYDPATGWRAPTREAGDG